LPEDRGKSKFASIWAERHRIQPEITSDWVNNDWAKGRNQLLTFHIRIRDRKLTRKIAQIQHKLSIIPCVDPLAKDYLHITVKSCGFLAESKTHEDDIPTKHLQKIISHAEQILKPFHKFNVCLPRLNVFSDVVAVEVHDEGKIGNLNKELQAIPEIKKMKFDSPDFLPHISIVQFKNNQGFPTLISYLEELRETEFGNLAVNHIELVNAHLLRKYITLKTIHTFELRQQHYLQS